MVTALFTEKAEAVNKLPKRPNDDEMLQLYGLYKQANFGDNTAEKPGALQFTGKLKWDAWESNKGLSIDQAESDYIALVDKLIEKYSV